MCLSCLGGCACFVVGVVFVFVWVVFGIGFCVWFVVVLVCFLNCFNVLCLGVVMFLLGGCLLVVLFVCLVLFCLCADYGVVVLMLFCCLCLFCMCLCLFLFVDLGIVFVCCFAVVSGIVL